MSALPLRQRILEACGARLATIATPDWYAPHGGVVVVLGEAPELGPDEPPAVLAVVPGDDAPRRQGDKLMITLPIELQAVVRVDLDEPHVKAEALLAAIKRAFELADRTLGGLVSANTMERGQTRVLPRDMGQTTMGLGITYELDYQETWGAP